MAKAIIQVSQDGVRPADDGAGTAAVVVDARGFTLPDWTLVLSFVDFTLKAM